MATTEALHTFPRRCGRWNWKKTAHIRSACSGSSSPSSATSVALDAAANVEEATLVPQVGMIASWHQDSEPREHVSRIKGTTKHSALHIHENATPWNRLKDEPYGINQPHPEPLQRWIYIQDTYPCKSIQKQLLIQTCTTSDRPPIRWASARWSMKRQDLDAFPPAGLAASSLSENADAWATCSAAARVRFRQRRLPPL